MFLLRLPSTAKRQLGASALALLPLVLAACVPLPVRYGGTVSGRVVDAVTGEGIAGAVVVVRYDARHDDVLPDRDRLGHLEAVTDARGVFRAGPLVRPGLTLWPLVGIEARVVGAMHENYRCPLPTVVDESGRVQLRLHPALDLEDRRRACRPLAAAPKEIPRYLTAWRDLYPRGSTPEQDAQQRQLERLLTARGAFGFGENCVGPVDELTLAPAGDRLALRVSVPKPSVHVIALAGRPQVEVRLALGDGALAHGGRLVWSRQGQLMAWRPASPDALTGSDRLARAHAGSARLLWPEAVPAAQGPSSARARLQTPEVDLDDESDVRWNGRSFSLHQALDPDTGLAVDWLKVTLENGDPHVIRLPGEACGSQGRFGRPQYRISADGRVGIDLRHVRGGCHAVAIDLETGTWGVLDDVKPAGVCRETRRVPASLLASAARGWMLELEEALIASGADPGAAYTLQLHDRGGVVAISRTYAGESVRAAVSPFPISTPLRRIDVSVVGGSGGGARPVPGIDPL